MGCREYIFCTLCCSTGQEERVLHSLPRQQVKGMRAQWHHVVAWLGCIARTFGSRSRVASHAARSSRRFL